jgi:hypothetical protein
VTNESRDPLGKRALFWAPAQRDDHEPRPSGGGPGSRGRKGLFSNPTDYDGPERRSKQGKYALFSSTAGYEGPDRRGDRHRNGSDDEGGTEGAGAPAKTGSRHGHLLDDLDVTDYGSAEYHDKPKVSRSKGSGLFGSKVVLLCSTCGFRSDVDPMHFLSLHLPVWFWRPGRGFTRFLTCPNCKRRTWMSASWRPFDK